jgi:hypothetical protein
MISNTGILIYRILVFSLAAFYTIYICIVSDWTQVGGPSRFLTVWGLFFSLLISWRVLQNSLGQGNNRWDVFVSSSAIVNAMVVFLYWKLFLKDPMSVTTNGQLDVWWREYYMHLIGPVLMWIDALFINRVFQKLKKTILWLTTMITTYIVWIEFVVRPLNDSPVGKVTNGLPYPFLNDLFLFDRLLFYAVNFIVAMIFLALFSTIARIFRSVFVG